MLASMRNFYHLYLEYIEKSDPRVNNWPLMHSAVPTLIISAVYVLMIFVGQRIMKSREALNLNTQMICYNFSIVLLSFYMWKQLLLGAIQANYTWTTCQSVSYSDDPAEMKIAETLWLYYFSKVIEMMDTAFFVMRKKNNQVTFLHVYHHVSMLILWWINVKWAAAFFGPFCNCFIHVFMYLYYGLAALGPKYRKFTWWKKYLTTMQLIQFTIVIIHGSIGIYYTCDYPSWMQWLLFFYMNSLLLLFINFYRKTYTKKEKTQ